MTLGWSVVFLICHFSIILFMPAPIKAEYWLRELIEVKQALIDRDRPKIVFLGGSSVLLGIDAKLVSEELGIPAFNLGLQAELRLDRLLLIAQKNVRRGDVLVMPLEYVYYNCDQESWNDWQLINAIAWDRPHFDGLPLMERLKAVYSAETLTLPAKIIFQYVVGFFAPPEARLRALAPSDAIWARYLAGTNRTPGFSYSAYNIDRWGDLPGNVGTLNPGAGVAADKPSSICPSVLETLIRFVAGMKAENIRVIFGNAPYLVDKAPAAGWQAAAASFEADLARTGAPVMLDKRDQLFFPRSAFFNTNLHLNESGRHARTLHIIANLRRLNLGPGNVQD